MRSWLISSFLGLFRDLTIWRVGCLFLIFFFLIFVRLWVFLDRDSLSSMSAFLIILLQAAASNFPLFRMRLLLLLLSNLFFFNLRLLQINFCFIMATYGGGIHFLTLERGEAAIKVKVV